MIVMTMTVVIDSSDRDGDDHDYEEWDHGDNGD